MGPRRNWLFSVYSIERVYNFVQSDVQFVLPLASSERYTLSNAAVHKHVKLYYKRPSNLLFYLHAIKFLAKTTTRELSVFMKQSW